jgi:type I restriction enzyme S subunit
MSDATESSLPLTWLRLELGNVVAYGSTEKAEPEAISPDTWVLELEDIEKDTSRIIQKLSFTERQSKSTKNCFECGDVLYGKLRPYLNKVIHADQAGVCTTEIVPIKPNLAVNGRFLYHWLRHPEFLNYVTEVSHGVNMPRLGTEAGRAAPFILAPLPEQKRIADKLDSVLARVDACRNRLDHLPALLKRFRQSILAAATSGRLTEDWRTETQQHGVTTNDDLPPGWKWSSPESIKSKDKYALAIGPFGSNLKVPDYRTEGIPLVFVREIRARQFGGPATKYVTEEKAKELSAHSISGGDLLITKMGDPPGDTAIYPSSAPPAVITADCIKFKVDEQVASNTFIQVVMESPQTKVRLQEITAGVAQQKISLQRFKGFPLPLAPISEQTEIVRRVEILFAFADRLEARLASARRQVGQLTPALLAKAFRGELVAQDPADEPAAELLKRLAAERESTPKAKRGRAKA